MDLRTLIHKYKGAGPRYTSYPTAPHWSENVNESVYRDYLQEKSPATDEPLAMYVHLPFCEALCYYCGCNVQITKDRSRADRYVEALVKELSTTSALLGARRHLSQISWGGGTPTFLTLELIERLFHGITSHFGIDSGCEISIEVDPNVTSAAQLGLLRRLGFNRVSLGLQDFNLQVQKAVNRVQSFELTRDTVQLCRSLGFAGINIDLIYGLPLQTVGSFDETVSQILEIQPDRIALYHYAHLPSLRPHQRTLEKYVMPTPDERTEIFLSAFDQFTQGPYRPIGMDHFAVQTDEMYQAIQRGKLYRNFMGYAVARGAGMLGIGASSIGEMEGAYFQNVRAAKDYEAGVGATGLATLRGCLLSGDDMQRKWVIQNIMCGFEVRYPAFQKKFGVCFQEKFQRELEQVPEFAQDGIIELADDGFRVTPLGRVFVRNLAMVFDAYLQQSTPATYSQTV